MTQAPVTADDVARRAGVSRWTVTRAFKSGASISEKRREAVLRAASELGYVPDLLASGLASARSGLVGLLIDDFENAHKLPVLAAITAALQEAGLAAILVNTSHADTPAAALLHARQRRVDATVLIGSRLDDDILADALEVQRPKRLIVFARETTLPGIASISCDDVAAVREIADLALRRGHRRAAYLAGPNTERTQVSRSQVFARHLSNAGLPEPGVMLAGTYSQSAAFRTVSALLASPEPLPDLLFCENDVLAFGAMDAIREHGLRVPEDIAVVGFDNLEMAASRAYDLTSYEQPLPAMADLLVDILTAEDFRAEPHVLPGRLVLRGSAGRGN